MHDATHTCSGTPSSPRSSTLTPTYVTSKSPPARPTRPVDLSYVGVVTEQNAADGFVGLIRHRPHWTALRHLSSWLRYLGVVVDARHVLVQSVQHANVRTCRDPTGASFRRQSTTLNAADEGVGRSRTVGSSGATLHS